MAVNLKGKSFLTLMDLTPQEIRYLLDLGHDLKSKRRAVHVGQPVPHRHAREPRQILYHLLVKAPVLNSVKKPPYRF